MAIKQGRAFRHVSIIEDDHSFGRVLGVPIGEWFRPDINSDGRTRNLVEAKIGVSLAGPLAEQRFRGLDDFAELHGSVGDLSDVVDMAMYVCGSAAETETYIAWLTERTRVVIRNDAWWSTIERLADELLVAGTIGYRRARTIVMTPPS